MSAADRQQAQERLQRLQGIRASSPLDPWVQAWTAALIAKLQFKLDHH
jgi:hypothetical protein